MAAGSDESSMDAHADPGAASLGAEEPPIFTPTNLRAFVTASEAAQFLRCSLRTVHELTRTNRIPYRKLPNGRRCLFTYEELAAWANGAPLTVSQPSQGGVVVSVTATEPANPARRLAIRSHARGTQAHHADRLVVNCGRHG